MVSRRAHNPKTGGSIPSPASIIIRYVQHDGDLLSGESSNGRTADSDSVSLGSNPSSPEYIL